MNYKIIASQLATLLHIPESTITPDTTIYDLGMDSLDMIELLTTVEDKYKIDIPEDIFMKAKTIKDLVVIADNLGIQA